MSYALTRVATELKDQLDRYGIEVRGADRVILYEDRAIRVDPYTTSRKCKTILLKMIKDAKQKAAAKQQEKQANLFGEG